MPSKYSRKRKHDLDEDTSAEAGGDKFESSPQKRSKDKSKKSSDNNEESISIEETNRIRAELGLAPLEIEEPAVQENESPEKVERADGGVVFKEDGVEIVHKAAQNLTEDKKAEKMREKLQTQKDKHRIYGKVLGAQKGLADSDSDNDDGGVDNFLDRMRAEAEKKAKAFDSMDQEAEQQAIIQRPKPRAKKEKDNVLASGMLVGHSKNDFMDGTETILVLQDKSVLDEDSEEVLVNPNLVDNERHKHNAEKRKQKTDYNPYADETLDEFGNAKKKSILDKYDDEAKREVFRLDTEGSYDLDREEHELEMKRRLMMANKKLESLETPKYVQAREFYTEEEMLTFRKPKKKKDKTRKSRSLKAADLETTAEEETAKEKAEKAKRLAARRRERGEDAMEVDEVPKNGESKKPTKEMEDGEVVETEAAIEIAAPKLSKWKQGTGSSVDLSRIRSFAAKVNANEDNEEGSEDEEDLVQGVDLTGVIIDDEAEDELYGVLANTRKLKQIKSENNDNDRGVKYIREMISSDDAIKNEPDSEELETRPFADGIIIDATSEQYKMIGEIPTFGLAGNRNDDVDYSELIAEHKRIMEQQAREMQKKEHKYSDEEELSDSEAQQIKKRDSDESDMEMEVEEEKVEKPLWKTIGDEEPTSSKHSSTSKSVRSYRKGGRSKHEEDEASKSDYTNVLGEERDVTKGVGAMLRLAAEKGYLENTNRHNSGGALKHLESKRFSRVDQGRMDIEDKYIRKLERMGTTGSGPIRPFAEKSDYKPSIEITYTDRQGRILEEKEAFRELSHKFHGKGSGKKQIEKRQAKLNKKERMKQMNSADTPLGTLQKQLKKQEQLQSPFIILSGSNRSDLGATLQKD